MADIYFLAYVLVMGCFLSSKKKVYGYFTVFLVVFAFTVRLLNRKGMQTWLPAELDSFITLGSKKIFFTDIVSLDMLQYNVASTQPEFVKESSCCSLLHCTQQTNLLSYTVGVLTYANVMRRFACISSCKHNFPSCRLRENESQNSEGRKQERVCKKVVI